MSLIYQIREYGSFVSEKQLDGYVTLKKHTFEQLEEFILANRSKDADALERMGLSAKKGIGKVITAKNYVGLITLTDGTAIEILPKICSELDSDASGVRTKRLLLDMLKTLRNTPYKTLQSSNVNIHKMNILEIFIRMFIDEVFSIVKRGLKCGYETVEENVTFFRGKIIFSRQIQMNHAHKERSYVEFDDYSVNRPENRLLKSTLLYLYKHTTSSRNRNDIRSLLDVFYEVEVSADYRKDFSQYTPDRNMKDYSIALMWSRVFLSGKSFTSFSGSEIALALLFPMEVLFESYIATIIKKKLSGTDYTISIQDRSHHLFDVPSKKFLLRPDIVVERKSDKTVFVFDTKWKLLSDTPANYGISQSDMYQVYAYQKKYKSNSVTLIYPKTDAVSTTEPIRFQSDDGAIVNVMFVDLFDVHSSIDEIFDCTMGVSHCG